MDDQVTALGDLAEKVAVEFKDQALSPLAELVPTPSTDEMKASIFTKIRFSWTHEDRAILERIRAASNEVFYELFADAIGVIDEFYAALRVPTGKLDSNNRMTWELGPDGKPIESIDQLTGQDIRQAVVKLQRLLLEITPQVSHLMMEAIMAHNIAKDCYDDAWFGVVEGTQGDRTARSNRESRLDRWAAFFKLYIYEVANSFVKELQAFIKRLENLDYRQTWAQK